MESPSGCVVEEQYCRSGLPGDLDCETSYRRESWLSQYSICWQNKSSFNNTDHFHDQLHRAVFFLKLTVAKLVMKLSTFYGTFITISLLWSQESAMNPSTFYGTFITVLTRACHESSPHPHIPSLKTPYWYCPQIMPRSNPFMLPDQNLNILLISPCLLIHPSKPIPFVHSNNI